nr:MAG TPA_asm: hypothetical protein [Caudoviricetes sp.]
MSQLLTKFDETLTKVIHNTHQHTTTNNNFIK